MSVRAERQSVTNTEAPVVFRSASIKLWPGAISVMVAACSANGAQTRVGCPFADVPKPRKLTLSSSSTISLGVTQPGSRPSGSPFRSLARSRNPCATAAANSLVCSAAIAGHRSPRAARGRSATRAMGEYYDQFFIGRIELAQNRAPDTGVAILAAWTPILSAAYHAYIPQRRTNQTLTRWVRIA
jgi:hypothetical protein